MESLIVLSEVVENKERMFGSNLEYYPAKVILMDGTEVNALFTKNVIDDAIERANVNPEDLPEDKKGWWFFK